MRNFEYCVFIGRLQPFHLAHAELLKEALEQAETAIVVLGSYNKAPDIRNPWTAPEREAMVRTSLNAEDNERVKFVYMRDYMYNDNLWVAELQQRINDITDGSNQIALIGHEYDRSSYYLNLFPQWKSIKRPNNDKCRHATDIRRLYFTHDAEYKQYVPPQTVSYLEEFKKADSFKNLKNEFDFIREYRSKWIGAPYEPTFVTVDAVVVKSGHVLVVRRKGTPGKGLIALPGGFLNPNEKIKDGALRELKEETGIKDLTKAELESAIVDKNVFDHPERSLRGRTITHAFFIDLKHGKLPIVKGADDADKAWWMPLSEFMRSEEKFFEDHWHIISYFCMKF